MVDVRHLIARWLFKEQWNFVEVPSFEEFSAYSSAVLAAASGDGVLHPDERNWIVGYFATIGLPDEAIATFQQAEATRLATESAERLVAFRNTPAGQVSCRGLVYDCIRAASADATYNADESRVVHQIARHLGIDDDITAAIEAVHRQELEHKAARLRLLFPDGIPFMQRPPPGTPRPSAARDIIAAWYFNEAWDFRVAPSMTEFSAYADSVLAAAAGDGVIAPAERDWVVGYFATIGMPEAALATFAEAPVTQLTTELVARLHAFRATPAGQVSCRGLVYDCIRASGADADYNAGESERTRRIAHELGIDEGVSRSIEALYHREQVMKRDRLGLFFPQGIAFFGKK
jgi:uncharacterized membrane protein YebE (DUF533 family)